MLEVYRPQRETRTTGDVKRTFVSAPEFLSSTRDEPRVTLRAPPNRRAAERGGRFGAAINEQSQKATRAPLTLPPIPLATAQSEPHAYPARPNPTFLVRSREGQLLLNSNCAAMNAARV